MARDNLLAGFIFLRRNGFWLPPTIVLRRNSFLPYSKIPFFVDDIRRATVILDTCGVGFVAGVNTSPAAEESDRLTLKFSGRGWQPAGTNAYVFSPSSFMNSAGLKTRTPHSFDMAIIFASLVINGQSLIFATTTKM